MRLVLANEHLPDAQTFKRLMLVADEIGFMDRPSVRFQDWGTIGRESEIRRFKVEDDSPVKISAYTPPSGPAEDLYLPYISADLRNPHFLRSVFEGLRDDEFAWNFIQPNAKHGKEGRLGTELRAALLADPSLPDLDITNDLVGPMFVGDFNTSEYRRALFKMVVIEASILATSTLLVTDQAGLMPVTDDRNISRLLALRMVDEHYVGEHPQTSGPLAIAIASALIPDEALEKLTFGDVLAYRRKTKDAYVAWSTEVDRLAVTISDISPDALARELPGIIHREFRPRILEYRNEMKAARDQMFGDLIKTVTKWELPSLSVAYLASLSVTSALALFAGALVPAIPAVVDYYNRRRDLNRTSAAAYLVGVLPDSEP